MVRRFKDLFISFFARHLTRPVRELYSSTLIMNFAVSAVVIFEPVFLYTILNDYFDLTRTLQLVLLYYLTLYIVYFFILPLGAKFAMRFGYEKSIAVSTVATACFYLSFFGIKYSFWFIPVSLFFYAWCKAFYWPAYHSNFAKFSVDGEQGRQISNLLVLESLVCILGPFFGGLISEFLGFGVLFVIASVLLLVSNIPMLITKEEVMPTRLSYLRSYKRLFSRERRRRFFSLVGYAEEIIVVVIWPIFIYVVVKDFLGLGFLMAISTFLSIIVFLYIGRFTDRADSRALLRRGTIFYFFSWLFRLFSRSVFGVFLIDSYSRISKQSIAIPLTAKTYEKAQDTSVIKTILFFEMSLVVGKIVIMALSILLLQFFAPGWNTMFILAGLFSLLYLLFK